MFNSRGGMISRPHITHTPTVAYCLTADRLAQAPRFAPRRAGAPRRRNGASGGGQGAGARGEAGLAGVQGDDLAVKSGAERRRASLWSGCEVSFWAKMLGSGVWGEIMEQ